ncbi:MAG: hypothetical protein B7X04_02880 [Parcubacteria group bacterium 21-54-25]|nr:MAG: hypothetical protein B7X04_02880 [Parcubacteria group bacterium 21-54-25]HQU07906.1 ATP-binding protein [Candidatus Paceibacterota bacterium]
MGALTNLDLFIVGVVVAATLVLGASVYFSDRQSISNKMFLGFSLVTASWGVINYLSYQFSNPTLTIWLLRGILFFAVFQSLFLYEFFSAFPSKTRTFSSRHKFLLLPLVGVAALLTLTPYVFIGIIGTVEPGQVAVVQKGPGLIIFAIIAIGLVSRALYMLLQAFRDSRGSARRAIAIIFSGTAITFVLIITFNFVIATIFTNPRFVPLGALFVFPFVAFTSYAILREHLFNIKVATTASLVFLLSVASFGEIIFSDTLPLVLFRTSVFVLVLVFGINLIRGVLREVEQREKIEKLAKELEETNHRQETLIHFIGHEVKSFLTKDVGALSVLAEGDFGALSTTGESFVEDALAQAREGVRSVTSILQAANLKRGTVAYHRAPFDLMTVVKTSFAAAQGAAKEKGLVFTLSIDQRVEPYTITGDADQLREHVFRNLIENAIAYTLKGSVAVALGKNDAGAIVFAVKDTGVGITDEDKRRLFTEGGHGKDSLKVNAHSTGYGLYIAKQIVDAHGGTVRAESEGAGKGSTFVVTLPSSRV